MSYERIKAATRTLRVRLMLWDAAAVLLTAVAVLVGVREGVRFALLHEIDEVLLEDIDEIILLLAEPRPDGDATLTADLDRKARGHTHHTWFVMFLDKSGQPTWASDKTPAESFSDAEIPLGKASSHRGFRIIRSALPKPTHDRHWIVVGSSLEISNDDLARIDQLVIVISVLALILAPVGGFLLAARAIQPIAEQTRTAARLRPTQLNERLPIRGSGDELDQLAVTFNALLDRTAEYLQQKHDFLANAAHELRTPLAAIHSSVEVALNSDRSAEEYRELLTDVIEETKSLEVLVKQLLLLAEADADRLKMHAEPVRLDELIQAACDMFQAAAEVEGIRLEVRLSSGVTVEGNRQHLRQVINNLIDNAIKYSAAKRSAEVALDEDAALGAGLPTPPPAVITITLKRGESPPTAMLTVADQGIGIAAEHLPHIFDRFYRADHSRARTGSTTGTGLGLSICHAIITAHRGSISVTSELGHGSRFLVTLPLV
ncbi:MAG: sensor histidine kinase [Planctomycetaceae bacterium]